MARLCRDRCTGSLLKTRCYELCQWIPLSETRSHEESNRLILTRKQREHTKRAYREHTGKGMVERVCYKAKEQESVWNFGRSSNALKGRLLRDSSLKAQIGIINRHYTVRHYYWVSGQSPREPHTRFLGQDPAYAFKQKCSKQRTALSLSDGNLKNSPTQKTNTSRIFSQDAMIEIRSKLAFDKCSSPKSFNNLSPWNCFIHASCSVPPCLSIATAFLTLNFKEFDIHLEHGSVFLGAFLHQKIIQMAIATDYKLFFLVVN